MVRAQPTRGVWNPTLDWLTRRTPATQELVIVDERGLSYARIYDRRSGHMLLEVVASDQRAAIQELARKVATA